mgnify:CR=1 FL=1
MTALKEGAETLLIVEDEAQIRKFVRISLEAQGYRVWEARLGEEGLNLCAATPPHLVILDLGLPDVDGLDFIRRLRAWSAIPILVLSVRASETEKIQALDAGANDYVTKPFGIGELMARVRVLLRKEERLTRAHLVSPDEPVAPALPAHEARCSVLGLAEAFEDLAENTSTAIDAQSLQHALDTVDLFRDELLQISHLNGLQVMPGVNLGCQVKEFGFGMYEAVRDAFCKQPAGGWPVIEELAPKAGILTMYASPPCCHWLQPRHCFRSAKIISREIPPWRLLSLAPASAESRASGWVIPG